MNVRVRYSVFKVYLRKCPDKDLPAVLLQHTIIGQESPLNINVGTFL